MSTLTIASKAEEQQVHVRGVIDEIERRGGNYLATKRLEAGDLHGAASQLHHSGMADLGNRVESIIHDGI